MTKLERFWAKVQRASPTECWIWTGGVNSRGYGKFWAGKGDSTLAHRFAYRLAYGFVADGLLVLHHCDNRRCVNPSHLFLGSALTNTQDALTKGRLRFPPKPLGEKNVNAKLSEAKVREIRRLYATNRFTQKELGRRFGVSHRTISHVVRNETWRFTKLD